MHEVRCRDSPSSIGVASVAVLEAVDAGSANGRPRCTLCKSAGSFCLDINYMSVPSKEDRLAGQRPSTCYWHGIAWTDVRRTCATTLPKPVAPADCVVIDLLPIVQTCGKAAKRRNGKHAHTVTVSHQQQQ